MSKFHAERIEAAIQSNSAALSPIVASWERSLYHYGLDPQDNTLPERLDGIEIQLAREKNSHLLYCANIIINSLGQSLDGFDACVILSDNEGVLLQRYCKNVCCETFDRAGLLIGGQWSEKVQGTNSIGTCLFENRPVAIRLSEHFLARNTSFSGATAPIFDPRGQLIGGLDISGYGGNSSALLTNLFARLVQDAAHKIEAKIFADHYHKARIINITKPDCTGVALLAINQHDIVQGATRLVRHSFHLSDEKIANGILASDLLGDRRDDGFSSTERSLLNRALVKSKGNISAAARALGVSRATLHRKLAKLKITHS